MAGFGIYTGSSGLGYGEQDPVRRQSMGLTAGAGGTAQPSRSPAPYIPTIPFGAGAAPAAASTSGMPDWGAQFVDSRRPAGAATGLQFDEQWGKYFGGLTEKYGKDFVPYAYRSGEEGALGWDPSTVNIFQPGYTLDYGAGMDEWGTITKGFSRDPITGEMIKGGEKVDMQSMNGGFLDPTKAGYKNEGWKGFANPSLNTSLLNPFNGIFQEKKGSQAQARMNDSFMKQYEQAKALIPSLTYQQYVDMYNRNVEHRWKEYG